jgi:polar amino acid transport system substrate-binding protein
MVAGCSRTRQSAGGSRTDTHALAGAATTWAIACALCATSAVSARADGLDDVRARGRLLWGADKEGGGPFVYPDPDSPDRVVGFEVELAALLARELGVKDEFFQGQWDTLPSILQTGKIDIVLNGYELMPGRAAQMDYTTPYYIYQLGLLARRDDPALRDWKDLRRGPGGRRPRIGVLVATAAQRYLEEDWAEHVDVVSYDSTTDAMEQVRTGQLDATLTDMPVVTFYGPRYPGLKLILPPASYGYWVIYVRKGDTRLRDAVNAALLKLMASGELKAIYERYGMWSALQAELEGLARAGDADLVGRGRALRGWDVIRQRGIILLKSAGMTVLLSATAMPLAIAIGLAVAIGRLYGPAGLRWPLVGYVEFLRGTPLMLQLYVLFFLLPEIGLSLPATWAAIAGLAINYSAYEAEIYRAGIQSIPKGQMEAALALGMSRALALRRVIVPQAVRIVIPPVTNDFIALFKDTSVCSVITVVELTKQYSIQKGDTGATVELAVLTAILYLVMSIPLSHFASGMEKRLGARRLTA